MHYDFDSSSADLQQLAEDDSTIDLPKTVRRTVGGSDRSTTTMLPAPRPWGFCVFLASALTLVVAGKQPADRAQQRLHATLPPPTLFAGTSRIDSDVLASYFTAPARLTVPPAIESDEPVSASAVNVGGKSVLRPSRDELSFETESIVTTEKAVAAVFVLKRSRPMSGLTRVRWASRSGTADAAIDFSDASGTAMLAEGQRQAALYVPLRNDLLKEGDETFKVCLYPPEHARMDAARCADATIRDDD